MNTRLRGATLPRTILFGVFIPVAALAAFSSIIGTRQSWPRPFSNGTRPATTQAADPVAPRGRRTTGERLLQAAPVIALPVLVLYFVIWYGRKIIGLPPFGDAANHARIASSILEHGPWQTSSPYPPLYHTLAGIALALRGDQGIAIITIASLAGLGLAVYAFAHEVTGSRLAAPAATLIAFVSPKLAQYAGRMYMEVLLSAVILCALTFIHRYLRMRRRRDLIVAAFVVGIACLTKQQALFLLVAALVYLSAEGAWDVVRRRTSPLTALWAPGAFALVTAVMVVPIALTMFHTTGQMLPDTTYTAAFNRVGAGIAGYQAPQEPPVQQAWDGFLQARYEASGEEALGQQRAESRHIWPSDVLTPRGFLAIHSTFIQNVEPALNLGIVFQLMLVAGLALWVKSPRSRAFVCLCGIWLVLNYLSFVRENDQQRYYVYIAFAASFAIPLFVERVAAALKWQLAASMLVLAGGVILYANSYLPRSTHAIAGNATTQAYAPSIGGIESVRDASAFLSKNVAADMTYYAVPTTEFQYYSRRNGVFDPRIDFLNRRLLAQYFADHNVEFIVIPQSLVRPDETWNHVGTVPKSFAMKISSMYPVAYQTPARDITVYRVLQPQDIGPLRPLDWNAPDLVAIQWPPDGESVAGTIQVSAVAHDATTGVKSLMYYVDGIYQGGLPGSHDAYMWTWNTRTTPNGRHTITVKAVDGAGNFVTKSVLVNVNN